MQSQACHSIKDALIAYLGEFTDVVQDGEQCIVTVPIMTLDNRWVDITVEEKAPDSFLVHDAGKAVDELFLQGLPLSDSRLSVLHDIAFRHGIDLVDDAAFVAHCRRERLQQSIWTVAQCSSIAMGEILRHRAAVEEESFAGAVGQIVSSWGKEKGVSISSSIRAKGRTSQHTFDFVASRENLTVAINVLNPSSGPLAKAKGYGYQVLDLGGTSYDDWKKVAVLSKPDIWTPAARRIVSSMATRVVEFYGGDIGRRGVINSLEELLAA